MIKHVITIKCIFNFHIFLFLTRFILVTEFTSSLAVLSFYLTIVFVLWQMLHKSVVDMAITLYNIKSLSSVSF